jgi:hypothetical protein
MSLREKRASLVSETSAGKEKCVKNAGADTLFFPAKAREKEDNR